MSLIKYARQYAKALLSLKFARTPELDAHERTVKDSRNSTGWAALADHYQDNDEPGAGLIREHADRVQRGQTRPTEGVPNPAQGWMDLPNHYENLWRSHFERNYHDLPGVRNPLLAVRERKGPHATNPPVVVSLLAHNAGWVHVPVGPHNVEQVTADLGTDAEVIRRAVARQHAV